MAIEDSRRTSKRAQRHAPGGPRGDGGRADGWIMSLSAPDVPAIAMLEALPIRS